MGRSEIVVIIPAFNEAATVFSVVSSVLLYAKVIVVDDCSWDATAHLAAKAGALVISTEKNQGYDSALNTGFSEANRLGFRFAITLDADGQHNPELIGYYIEHLNNGYDLVLGIRPKYARFGEWLFSLYTTLRFSWYDPLCGMKGYCMDIYQERGWFDSYKSIGTELALYGLLKNKPFIQVSIPINARIGASRFGGKWHANIKILRSIFFSLFKLY